MFTNGFIMGLSIVYCSDVCSIFPKKRSAAASQGGAAVRQLRGRAGDLRCIPGKGTIIWVNYNDLSVSLVREIIPIWP